MLSVSFRTVGSSAQPVSAVLQGLMDKYQITTSQVDREIQLKDIRYLAPLFDDVNLYVDVMELTPGEQTDVHSTRTSHLAMIKCLILWTRKNPAQATFRYLLEMLVKLKKEEFAIQICRYYLNVSLCVHILVFIVRVSYRGVGALGFPPPWKYEKLINVIPNCGVLQGIIYM